MRFGATTPRGDASFDLTPMIDVILLLIVFFMLSSQFSRTERMQVDLPVESGDELAVEEHPSEIVIDMTGQPPLLPGMRVDVFLKPDATANAATTQAN